MQQLNDYAFIDKLIHVVDILHRVRQLLPLIEMTNIYRSIKTFRAEIQRLTHVSSIMEIQSDWSVSKKITWLSFLSSSYLRR